MACKPIELFGHGKVILNEVGPFRILTADTRRT